MTSSEIIQCFEYLLVRASQFVRQDAVEFFKPRTQLPKNNDSVARVLFRGRYDFWIQFNNM